MNTGHELTQIIADLQEKKKVTKRRKAVEQLAQALCEETNSLSTLLTKNSLKSNKTLTSTKCIDYGWRELLFKVLISFQFENSKKWVQKTKDMYQHLKLIIDIAEKNGHFLKDNISEIIKLFKLIINDNDKLMQVGACLFDILSKLIKIPIYATKIKSNFYKELFHNISSSFSPPDPNYFNANIGWNHCSKHNSTILANLLCELIAAIQSSFSINKSIQFIDKYIVPFYVRYFTNNTRSDSAHINAILLACLNELLYKYSFNILHKYEVLCTNAFTYFSQLWDHTKTKNLGINPTVKTQIIKFINLFFKINNYLPNGVGKYDQCLQILYKIYPTFKSELNNTKSNNEMLLGPQYSHCKNTLKVINLCDTQYGFYRMLSNITHSLMKSDENNIYTKKQTNNKIVNRHININNGNKKRGKKRKRADKEEHDDSDDNKSIGNDSDIVIIEPPTKKQRTSINTSKAMQNNYKNTNIMNDKSATNSLIVYLSDKIDISCSIAMLQFMYVYLYYFNADITIDMHGKLVNGLFIQLSQHEKENDHSFIMWIFAVLSLLTNSENNNNELWSNNIKLFLTETIISSPPNVLSILFNILTQLIIHKRINYAQIAHILHTLMTSDIIHKKAFNTALITNSFCKLINQIFHQLHTHKNAHNEPENDNNLNCDELPSSLSSSASSPSPLAKVFSRLNLIRLSSEVSVENNANINHNNNTHNNNNNDINNYIYLLLQWLLTAKDLQTDRADLFVFAYIENNIHLTQWIVNCITNMLYYDFAANIDDSDCQPTLEHYRYDQSLFKYAEKQLQNIGIVQLIYLDEDAENDANDEEIMSFMCYDNIDKSPFHTQHLVDLSTDQWKRIQFAPFIKPKKNENPKQISTEKQQSMVQNITLIVDILDTAICKLLAMINKINDKTICIFLLTHYLNMICLLTNKWQLHSYIKKHYKNKQNKAEYHKYCKVIKSVLCMYSLLQSLFEALITICVNHETLVCNDKHALDINDSILYCIELLHRFISSMPSNDKFDANNNKNYQHILQKRIQKFAKFLSGFYWKYSSSMINDIIDLLQPSYFTNTNTKKHWESFGEGDVSAFITNKTADNMSQITLSNQNNKSIRHIMSGIPSRLIIGDIIRFCSIHKYFVLHDTSKCYDTAKRLNPYIHRIPPLLVRLYMQIFYILQFPKPFLINTFINKISGILFEYKTYPYLQSESMRYLIHTSSSIQCNYYVCDESNMADIERLYEKIWDKLGINPNEDEKYYPLTRYSYLLIISNCIQFQDNRFGEFGQWFIDLMDDEDYVLNQNINYVVDKLLLSYGAPQVVFESFLSTAAGIISVDNDDEKQMDTAMAMDAPQNTKEFVLNAFSMLAHLAVVNVEFEKQVLFELLKIYISGGKYQCIVDQIIQLIAQMLSFESPKAFIASHLEYILNRFCENEMKLKSFPVAVMDKALSFNQFIQSYQQYIISALVKARNMSALTQISNILNTSLIQLIQHHFAYVYCHSFCLLDDRSTYTKGNEIISSFLCSSDIIGSSPTDKMNNLLRKNHTTLMRNILDYYIPLFIQTEQSDINLMKKRFKKCLEILSTKFLMKTNVLLTGKFGIAIYQILLHLIDKFGNAKLRIYDKIGSIHITLMIFQELNKNDIVFPSTLRLAMHIITNCLIASKLPLHDSNMNVLKIKHNNAILMDVINIINIIVGQHFISQSVVQKEIISNYFCDIFSALFTLHTLDASKYKIEDKVKTDLHKTISSIITKLTVNCPQTLRESLAMIDFFPINMENIDQTQQQNGCWIKAYKVWCNLRGNPALLTTLNAFNKHMDSKRNRTLLIEIMLQTLDNTLCGKQKDLMNLWCENNSILCRVIENIMKLGSKYHRNYNICKLAANCMSRFGLVHPSLYIENKQKSELDVLALICTQVGDGSGMKQRDTKIIALIDSFLCNANAKIMSIAMQCMIKVLHTKYGSLAYSEIRTALRDLLKPLKNAKINDDWDENDIEMKDYESNDNVEHALSVWSFKSNETNFKAWICNICSYLIKQYLLNTSSVLGCCHKLCDISPRFAESVFPYIITDILHINTSPLCNNMHAAKYKNNSSSSDTQLLPWMHTALTLSYYFNSLISNYKVLPHKIVKLLLESIEYIRYEANQCENSAHSSSWFTWSGLQKQEYEKLVAKYKRYNKVKNRNKMDVEVQNGDFKTDIPTALIPSLSEQTFLFPSHVFLGHLDLLNVANACLQIDRSMSAIFYCHLWGIYAYGPDIPLAKVLSSSQTQISECQAILMMAYNSSHDSHGIYGIMDRNDGVTSDGMLYEHERRYDYALRVYSIQQKPAGTSRVLNGMGCHNLLYSYLDNIYPNATNMSDTYLSEAYYECCWRICEWDTMLSPSPNSNHSNIYTKYNNKNIGFHGSIFRALAALKSNNFDAFDTALCEGKLNLIKQTYTKKESIQPLYAIMVKWTMFNAIQTSWNLKVDNNDNYYDDFKQCMDPLFDLSKTYRGRDFFQIVHPQNIVLTNSNNISKKNNIKFIDDILFSSYDFDLIEPLLSLHSTLFWILPNPNNRRKVQLTPKNKIKNNKTKIETIKTQSCALISHLYFFAKIARNANRFSVAHRILQRAEIIMNAKKKARSDTSRVNLRDNEDILMEYCLKLEEGHLIWSEGYFERAIRKAQCVCNAMPRSDYLCSEKSYENQQIRAESDCVIGEWMMLSHLRDIAEVRKHLIKAESLCTNLNEVCIKKLAKYRLMFNNSLCRSHYLLAKFNDTIYKNIENKLQSQEWEQYIRRLNHQKKHILSLQDTVEQSKKEWAALSKRKNKKRNRNKTNDINSTIIATKQTWTDASILKRRIEREYNHDNKKKEQALEHRRSALRSSIDNYCNSLILDSKYDLFVLYRLISLWFDNYYDFAVTKSIAKYLCSDEQNQQQIPTQKLIPLVYQIASRLSLSQTTNNSNSEKKEKKDALDYFYCIIYKIIYLMASQHPYHCLYQIFQLSNVDKLNESARVKTGFQINKQKKLAALKLISELKTKNRDLEKIVIGIASLIDAYCSISAASSKEKTKHKRRHGQKVIFPIKNYPKMLNIVNMNILPIATVPIHINATDIAYICRYKAEAQLAESGITCPVIIDVLGSDGREYRELVKPQDDLRQDAVMEQVFGLCNKVLSTCDDNNKYIKKYVRTYKVVPLTPTIGIVEWVKGTIPMGVYLNKIHEKYKRKNDYLPSAARHTMNEAVKRVNQVLSQGQDKNNQNRNKREEILLDTYSDICARFPPMFHKFFLQYHADGAQDWFNARLSYIISCSVNSIIGYLLGLGDRHTQNILIDLATSELIHIDLGVAFDQGKLLKTPELVPFRLTRDIVDGFGLNSYHGTFKKICIQVLKLLRENQQIFYTVLRVFIHDPLYKWSLDPDKMNRLQHDRDENENKKHTPIKTQTCYTYENTKVDNNQRAERALHILRQKFQGNDNQQLNVISVEGQVNRLILQAIDTTNLSQMFHGWCSWM